MLYLFLATLCSATIALIFKYTENSNTNRYLITSSNYFIAFATSLFMILYSNLFSGIEKTDSFINEFKYLLSQDSYILSPYSSIIWGVIVGSVAGFFFFSSFIYYQKSVKENGVGLSGTFAKLGILIPMIFSIIFWREFPTALQWIGITISLVSIVIVNLSSEALERFDIKPTIILLFILGGMAEFSNKIYQNYALNDYKAVFLFCIFFVAFLISIVFTLKDKATTVGFLFNKVDGKIISKFNRYTTIKSLIIAYLISGLVFAGFVFGYSVIESRDFFNISHSFFIYSL